MKTPQECLRAMPKAGHSFDYVDWVKAIQKDARESIQIELDATRVELSDADKVIENLNTQIAALKKLLGE